MIKKLIVVCALVFLSFSVACSNVNEETRLEEKNNSNEISVLENDAQLSSNSQSNRDENNIENDEGSNEIKKRAGKIEMDNIEIIDVNEELVETIIALFKTIENNDYQSHFKFIYDPSLEDLSLIGPYILSVDKIETDDTRLNAVIDEYSLNEIADEAAIVKITMDVSSRTGSSQNTGDFIFIKVDGEWKLYKTQ